MTKRPGNTGRFLLFKNKQAYSIINLLFGLWNKETEMQSTNIFMFYPPSITAHVDAVFL